MTLVCGCPSGDSARDGGGVCGLGRALQALLERTVTGFRRTWSPLCYPSRETIVLAFVLDLALTCSAELLVAHSFAVVLGAPHPFFSVSSRIQLGQQGSCRPGLWQRR